MLPRKIKMKVMTREEYEVKREWSFCRCHYPGCTYISAKAHLVDRHVRTVHKEMKKDTGTVLGHIAHDDEGGPKDDDRRST
jgi:hypothetical protein